MMSPGPKPESQVMTVSEVAAYLHVSSSTIYRLLKRKQIPGFKLGRNWRFNRESVDAWMMRKQVLR